MAVCCDIEMGLTELVLQSKASSPAVELGPVAMLLVIFVCWGEDVFGPPKIFGSDELH